MNIFNWFKKNPDPKIQIVTKSVDSLTLHEWRAIPGLVSEAMRIEALPGFSGMVAVLANECPHNYTAGALDATAAIRQLGRIEGYQLALNNLALMAKPVAHRKQIEAVFEPPPEPKKA